MIKDNGIKNIYEIGSDHSPFFSRHKELLRIIKRIEGA
jgi:hypothetical protein